MQSDVIFTFFGNVELFFSFLIEDFEEGKLELIDHILHWGYQETKDDFLRVLRQADVAVSTANHEFFGVSM